ncbi:MAG: hypothetical protein EOO38_15100, partial [Cytophagaceae bacterium]
MINESLPTTTALDIYNPSKPFTGYVAVSHELMQKEGFADFLFDNFRMIRDLTTNRESLLGLNRFEMQSIQFTEGYGQYKIVIKRSPDGEFVIGSV